jgi:hypothetical protein
VEPKNQNGVQVYLASASKGVDLSLRGDEPEEIGFLIQARKERAVLPAAHRFP